MADPTRREQQKINLTQPGSKSFDPDPTLVRMVKFVANIFLVERSNFPTKHKSKVLRFEIRPKKEEDENRPGKHERVRIKSR